MTATYSSTCLVVPAEYGASHAAPFVAAALLGQEKAHSCNAHQHVFTLGVMQVLIIGITA